MNLRSAAIFLIILTCVLNSVPVFAERTMYLNVCQELVNSARAYEARATFHARTAKNIQAQIETYSRMPKDSNISQMIDTLFAQDHENRVLETKFRDLYRQTSEEAKKCMKSAE